MLVQEKNNPGLLLDMENSHYIWGKSFFIVKCLLTLWQLIRFIDEVMKSETAVVSSVQCMLLLLSVLRRLFLSLFLVLFPSSFELLPSWLLSPPFCSGGCLRLPFFPQLLHFSLLLIVLSRLPSVCHFILSFLLLLIVMCFSSCLASTHCNYNGYKCGYHEYMCGYNWYKCKINT